MFGRANEETIQVLRCRVKWLEDQVGYLKDRASKIEGELEQLMKHIGVKFTVRPQERVIEPIK